MATPETRLTRLERWRTRLSKTLHQELPEIRAAIGMVRDRVEDDHRAIRTLQDTEFIPNVLGRLDELDRVLGIERPRAEAPPSDEPEAAPFTPESRLEAIEKRLELAERRLAGATLLLASNPNPWRPVRDGWRNHFRSYYRKALLPCWWPLTPHTCLAPDWKWLERLRAWVRR